ncbi:hypothetical protein EHM69_05830 [candidate division KSB1 bacterium]|nr:MAG: hypothetical protein EHM69_05830 [candidate division KSB1 bacterium]
MHQLSRKLSVWLWILATVITLVTAVYQRLTGPTHPERGRVLVGDTSVRFRLLRTADDTGNALIPLSVSDPAITGEMLWKRYKSNDEWMTAPLNRVGDKLIASIPRQPPAGKVMYQISLIARDGQKVTLTQEPVVIRFKGAVPFYVLHPHILLMFFSMLIGTRAGLEALFNGNHTRRLAIETAAMLFVGGLILGPVIQKFAFGEFWTGWPFGHDLTDNKTAVAMLFWLIALWRDIKCGKGRGWYIAAAAIQLIVYSIPHSVLGSELDYTKQG